MTIFSKRNIILPGPDGQKFRLKKDYIGPVPAWAEKSAYLKALEKDGKIIISQPKPRKKAGEKEEPPSESAGGEK